MGKYLTSITAYIEGLSLREKLLLLAVFFAVIYSIWDLAFFASYSKQQQQTQAALQKANLEQQNLIVSIAQVEAKLAKNTDPNEKTKLAISQVDQELTLSQQQLEEKLDKLVSPTKITELLRNLLLQSQGLKLLSLNNEPVQIIELGNENGEQEEGLQTQLYEHATTIKLSGNYQQLHQYLEALEKSPWGLFWDQLNYVVKDYPKAEITLRVHTVSTDQHWIGL